MPVEPHPGFPPALIAVIAALLFRVTDRDPSTGAALGVWVDPVTGARRYLIAMSGGIDGTWSIVDELPRGFGPVLVDEHTAALIARATGGRDGSVIVDGIAYRIASSFDGAHWTARSVPA